MKLVNVALALFLILSLRVQTYEASRILYDEEVHKDLVKLQSLQRGSVPGSGSSGCTNIPNTGGPSCPTSINSMNVAGNALSHDGAYPRLRVEFGVATDQKPSS